MKPRYIIGIDPGTTTGVAIWDAELKRLHSVESLKIHIALKRVLTYKDGSFIFVRIEDARKRKWFGPNTKGKDQGAGSIKRDCSIWEDFCTDLKIPFEMTNPGNVKTKITSEAFKRMTGWQDKTNEHGRDAGMLVFNYIPHEI